MKANFRHADPQGAAGVADPGRHRRDEGELPPHLGGDVRRDLGLGPRPPQRRGDPLGPVRTAAGHLADDHPLERAEPSDDPRPDAGGADGGQAPEHLLAGDAEPEEALDDLDPVEQRHDDRAGLREPPGHRGDPRQRVVLHGEDHVLGTTEGVRVVGGPDGGGEGLLRRADLDAPRPQGVEVGAAGQHHDLVLGAGQQAAVIAADAARPQDRDPHDSRRPFDNHRPSR
jgi:hypothetical protein